MLVRVENVSRSRDDGPTSVLLRSLENPADFWQGSLATVQPAELMQVGARFEITCTLQPAPATPAKAG